MSSYETVEVVCGPSFSLLRCERGRLCDRPGLVLPWFGVSLAGAAWMIAQANERGSIPCPAADSPVPI